MMSRAFVAIAGALALAACGATLAAEDGAGSYLERV
jgi:hypothetical protein